MTHDELIAEGFSTGPAPDDPQYERAFLLVVSSAFDPDYLLWSMGELHDQEMSPEVPRDGRWFIVFWSGGYTAETGKLTVKYWKRLPDLKPERPQPRVERPAKKEQPTNE